MLITLLSKNTPCFVWLASSWTKTLLCYLSLRYSPRKNLKIPQILQTSLTTSFVLFTFRRQKLDEIKRRKLQGLREAGVPDKYCNEVARRIEAPPPSLSRMYWKDFWNVSWIQRKRKRLSLKNVWLLQRLYIALSFKNGKISLRILLARKGGFFLKLFWQRASDSLYSLVAYILQCKYFLFLRSCIHITCTKSIVSDE